MRILANMLGVQTGGARTYLLQMLQYLGNLNGAHECLVLAPSWVETEWIRIKKRISENSCAIRILSRDVSPAYRVYFDQFELPRLIRRDKCDLLWSANNYGCFRSPVPQLLMQCNPTFFSDRYARLIGELGTTKEVAEYWLRREHARQSIARADVTVFPTRAFMDCVLECLGHTRVPHAYWLHHGFDGDAFVSSELLADGSVCVRSNRPIRLFYPTSWAPHKNFGVLFDAYEILCRGDIPAELWLPLNGDERAYRGPFQRWMRHDFLRLDSARRGVRWLGYQSMAGVIRLYKDADLILFPSWLETFGYPLVEARAARRPLVAADTATNREVAGKYATYHPPFDPEALAAAVLEKVRSERLAIVDGDEPVSWRRHFSDLFAIMEEMI